MNQNYSQDEWLKPLSPDETLALKNQIAERIAKNVRLMPHDLRAVLLDKTKSAIEKAQFLRQYQHCQ